MRHIYELNTKDIKEIIANHFHVPVDAVQIEKCGYDEGDGYYSGAGYYCNISVNIGVKSNESHS